MKSEVKNDSEEYSVPIGEVDLRELREKGQTQINVETGGLAGFSQQLILQFYSPEAGHPLNSENPTGEPGKYKVIFTLSRPGFPLRPEDDYADAATLQGDSHLAIAKPIHPSPELPEDTNARIASEIEGDEFLFICQPNEKGFMAKLELESIDAANYGDAAEKAFRGVLFALSSISFRYDIPLHIFQVDIVELRTGSRRMSIVKAFRETPFAGDPERALDLEFRKYASYYREGMNSNSPNYQFLCYYKIIEGLRARRERLIAEAKARGEAVLSVPAELLPETKEEQVEWLKPLFVVPLDWDEMSLRSIFPEEVIGKKISRVIGKEFDLHQLRHKIAHAVLEKGEPTVSIDDAFDMELVNKWLPLTKYLARYMLIKAFPDKAPDKTPKRRTLKLYRSRRFSGKLVGDHMEYTPESDSLEYVRDIEAVLVNGKINLPAMSLDMRAEGINMDSEGNPTVIYACMEVQDDGSEHLLYTGYYHLASNSFRSYGKSSNQQHGAPGRIHDAR